MTVLSKSQALAIVVRIFGRDVAKSLAGRLPEHIDLNSPADTDLLFRLGVSRDRLFEALGAEL